MSVISDQISASNTTVAASLITATSSDNGSIIDDCTNPGAGKKERVNSSVTSSHSNRHLSASGTEYDCDYDQPRRGSIKESTEERLDNDNDNLFEGEDGIIDLFPNVAKLPSDVSEKYYLPRQWRKPDSYSSYSSLNNDECSVSLNSQDGNSNTTASNYHNANNNNNKQSSQIFETRQMEIRPPINYPRKYSLTVPGEPRHMRTLHRRESGSRSPLNSSCGGLSPSELSTPSPSCSNSINDDQSSCSSGGLNTIPIELSRKCTLSVDSLLLRTSSSSTNREHHKTLANNKKDLNRLDELCRRLFHLRTNSAASSSNSHHSREFVNSLSPTCKEFDDESDTFKEPPKVPKKRKDSMTAMIASMLLPDSICQKIGASFSTDRIDQQQHQQYSPHSSNSPSTSRSISSRNIFTSKGKTTSSNHHHQSKAERRSDTSSTAGPPETPPPIVERSRKGSIVQLTSASAGKIVRLLRRTHSAGCSKDVPSHALFLNTENKAERKKRQRKERKAKRGHRKQAPALEDMKQRLRFLRRRHTDSSLHSSTVRPSRDEVEKWSKSFRDLMANRYGSALFRAFLSREYSEENIEFWIACEEYRKARSSKLPHKAKKIFNNFLDVQSPKEVNLDPKIRMEIQQNLATPSKNTFDEAQRKIQGLLESDSYVRFLRSDLYTDLVISEIERNAQELNDNNNNENADAKPMPLSPESCSNALVNSISSSIVNQ